MLFLNEAGGWPSHGIHVGTNINFGNSQSVLVLLLRTLKMHFYVQSTKVEIY